MIPLTFEEVVAAVGVKTDADAGGRAAARPAFSFTGVTTDSRQVRAGDLFFAIPGPKYDGHAFAGEALASGALAAVVRGGRPLGASLPEGAVLIEVDDPVRALGRLGRYHRRQLGADVIAVTGSNGKTTTREMIRHVLGGRRRGRCSIKSFNNEIGVPLTLLSAEAADEFLVVEIGTNAPGEIDALARLVEPEVAVVTNVGPVHLERLGTVEGVAREKLSLLGHIRPGGCAIVNIDADAVRAELAEMRRRQSAGASVLRQDVKIVTVGRHEEADLRLTSVRATDGDVHGAAGAAVEFEVNGKFRYCLGVPGAHNASNALAAIAVARRFGMEHDEIASRLSPAGGFSLPAMRLERHRIPWRSGSSRGEVEIINDAYNANPVSVSAAIDVLRSHPVVPPGRRVIVLGEMRELGPRAGEYHESAAREVATAGIDVMLAVGTHAERMAGAVRAADGCRTEAHAAPDAEAATKCIGRLCRPGDVVLIKGSRAVGLDRVAAALVGAAT